MTADRVGLRMGQDKQNNSALFSYPLVETNALGIQKNRLIEAVLLNTHNICFN